MTMFTKTVVFAFAAVMALFLFSAVPASAQAYVQIAPPAPRYEVTPQPRRGKPWVPGYWEWRGNRHVWMRGQWVGERRGYMYNQPQWVKRGDPWETAVAAATVTAYLNDRTDGTTGPTTPTATEKGPPGLSS